MKIWVDDIRSIPKNNMGNWIWCKSTKSAIDCILRCESSGISIDLIDLDHDAGDFEPKGGDYIKILDWLEETNRNYPIRIHSANPVGIQNMRRIITKNNWVEIK